MLDEWFEQKLNIHKQTTNTYIHGDLEINIDKYELTGIN